ncbi:MAG: DUF1731 domain-containing protein [Deltaproteobacteria bacterium]|nr:DUF1731 domain-containing protein [Deltaproteobacteria bacterium]
MKLVVTGASGFIGSVLCSRLLQKGHTLTLLTRSAPRDPSTGTKRWLHWRPGMSGDWESALAGADGVINLAGEPIAKKRWTIKQKHQLRLSRIDTTVGLVRAIAKAKQKPKFLLNASAVGYYGPRGDETIGEEAPAGTDFLAALIHLEDEVGLIVHLIEHPQASGAVNATAPNPATMKEFCRTLGQVMGRPSWAPVPGFALRLTLGEMAEMLLTGQRVVPAAAQKLGYQFRYPNLTEALRACMPL